MTFNTTFLKCIFALTIIAIICLTSLVLMGTYAEIKEKENPQQCWRTTFIPPYVYLRTNLCTGEWSEEESKIGKRMYEEQLRILKQKRESIL